MRTQLLFFAPWRPCRLCVAAVRSLNCTIARVGLQRCSVDRFGAAVIVSVASVNERGDGRDIRASVALTGVTVLRIETVKQGDGSSVNAVRVVGKDSVTAWLAPAEFLSAKSISLAAGDVVDVTGSTLMAAGTQALIATEIRKGATKVVLRDKASGAPA